MATDGRLDPKYQLIETESAKYRQRTRLNVRDSDATLIVNIGALDGGTLTTIGFAEAQGKPHLVIQLDELTPGQAADRVRTWLADVGIGILNVAGPREEKRPGIYSSATALLIASLSEGRAEP